MIDAIPGFYEPWALDYYDSIRYDSFMLQKDDLLITGPASALHTIVLAHGAGVGMDAPFMESVTEGLCTFGYRTVRFEFPYMRAKRRDGKRRPPNPQAILMDAWLQVIEALRNTEGLVIGGKSMGGRIASMLADQAGVKGLVCLGYPFHPPGKQVTPKRTAHLEHIRTPCLILQGERDPFGNKSEISSLGMSKAVQIVFLDDGDHSFKPRVSSGRTHKENLDAAVLSIHRFCQSLAD